MSASDFRVTPVKNGSDFIVKPIGLTIQETQLMQWLKGNGVKLSPEEIKKFNLTSESLDEIDQIGRDFLFNNSL